MKHLGTQTLETGRLRLRQVKLEDAEAMYANWCSDAQVTKYLRWKPHTNVEETREIVASWRAQYVQDAFYLWVIALKEDDVPIGSISVVKHDDAVEMVHVGYCLGRAWWHQGIMSEALAELLRFFFTEVGVNRVESQHDPGNPNSGGVMLKCGLRHEGTLRQADYGNQGICDAAYYGILAKEYFAREART